jgi:hypothetical protein
VNPSKPARDERVFPLSSRRKAATQASAVLDSQAMAVALPELSESASRGRLDPSLRWGDERRGRKIVSQGLSMR